MSFSIYTTTIEAIEKSKKISKKDLNVIFGKKSSLPQKLNTFKELSANDVVLRNTTSREIDWFNNGAPIIFFDDNELVENLYNASFDFEASSFVVRPPFSSFSMSFLDGMKINGIELENVLVTIARIEEFHKMYSKLGNIDCSVFPDHKEYGISVQYYEKNNQMHNDNFTHFSTITKTHINNEKEPLQYQGTEKLNILLKLALSFCIHNTEGDKIEEGYPLSTVKINKKPMNKSIYKGFNSIKSTETTEPKEAGYKIVKKVPFYRQLTAERYYKTDKWKDEIRGSRWIFVNGFDKNHDEYVAIN